MRIEDWGLVEYESATQRQLDTLEVVNAGGEDVLVLCTHPPVVTLGRGAVPEDLQGWSGSLLETSRGGRATYHGPSQVVIYPIIDLKRERENLRARDVHAYLRVLEELTVASLREAGLPAPEARTSKIGELSLTGVWSGQKKIASIGIAIRKWITYHGIAINVFHDPAAFRGIRPCGFQADIMTSLEAELGRPVDRGKFQHTLAAIFLKGLSE